MKKGTKKLRHCYRLNYGHEKYKSLLHYLRMWPYLKVGFLTNVISYDEVIRVGLYIGWLLDAETYTQGKCRVKMKTEIGAVQLQARNSDRGKHQTLGEGNGAGSPPQHSEGPNPSISDVHSPEPRDSTLTPCWSCPVCGTSLRQPEQTSPGIFTLSFPKSKDGEKDWEVLMFVWQLCTGCKLALRGIAMFS